MYDGNSCSLSRRRVSDGSLFTFGMDRIDMHHGAIHRKGFDTID